MAADGLSGVDTLNRLPDSIFHVCCHTLLGVKPRTPTLSITVHTPHTPNTTGITDVYMQDLLMVLSVKSIKMLGLDQLIVPRESPYSSHPSLS